jgi:perosamine synthetase
MHQVPVNTPLVDEGDVLAVSQALRDGWISGEGPVVAKFEHDFASFCDRKHGVSVTNGTAAIELVIHSLGFGKGDEIIVPSFAIISCVSQILRCGATPIFIDADPFTWNMDVNAVEELITPRTKAIMAVHTYGLPVDMDVLEGLAKRHNLVIIEDAAESHGLLYKGKRCGSFGLVSTFSFYANKHLTTGEGGMVVTDDDSLAQKLRYYRNLTFRPENRFVHDELGWNLRMSSLQCALGSSQLTRIDQILERRRALGETYQRSFSDLSDVQTPLASTQWGVNDYWVFGLVLVKGRANTRDQIQAALADVGVGTRPFFWPLHLQPVLKSFGLGVQPSLPVAENLGSNGFYIPNGLGMSSSDTEYVIEQVRKILQ